MGDGAIRGTQGDRHGGKILDRLPIEESVKGFERMPHPGLHNHASRKTGIEALDSSTAELLRKLQQDGKAETNLRHVVPGLNPELRKLEQQNPQQMMPPRLEREGMPTGAENQTGTEMPHPGKGFNWKLIQERARMNPTPSFPRPKAQFPPRHMKH
ncbi:MAG: hypothetical protein KC777_22770 [Cyanobacteria bacterium HKST-UBA02]|nr:hypothetical protein [Cyanobacteria bacterium HKST-UBA02]